MRKRNENAILLIGPTGSGKTPLGELCQERGLENTKCFHFDFGENLRKAAERESPDSVLRTSDIVFIRKVLSENALLEGWDFHLAEKVIISFMYSSGVERDDILLLNGIPRHVEQAEQLDKIIKIRKVINLRCSPEVVMERIKKDTGGDRGDRTDDSPEEIRKKIETFNTRTIPLVNHYRELGTEVVEFDVDADTQPYDIYKKL